MADWERRIMNINKALKDKINLRTPPSICSSDGLEESEKQNQFMRALSKRRNSTTAISSVRRQMIVEHGPSFLFSLSFSLSLWICQFRETRTTSFLSPLVLKHYFLRSTRKYQTSFLSKRRNNRQLNCSVTGTSPLINDGSIVGANPFDEHSTHSINWKLSKKAQTKKANS